MSTSQFDVLILGAGAAGLMCAIEASKRHRTVCVVEGNSKIGAKILISGGGRCNFTNLSVGPEHFVSQNPHFCKSALSRYAPEDFLALVKKHKIRFHEKKLGQLFCDKSAREIVEMLKSECDEGGVNFKLESKVLGAQRGSDNLFCVKTVAGELYAQTLVVATGGLSIPQIGASGVGYEIAKSFGLRTTSLFPALDGFTLSAKGDFPFQDLSGVSADCILAVDSKEFRENILFTHKGLSGPAALQASLHWQAGKKLLINFFPDRDLLKVLTESKKQNNRSMIKSLLGEYVPSRLAEALCMACGYERTSLFDIADVTLAKFCDRLQAWSLSPTGTVGYSKAEVTRGGVDTRDLSSKTLEAIKVKGLFFVGEVVDVSGWLGGYNFQWAWASGWAAGQAV